MKHTTHTHHEHHTDHQGRHRPGGPRGAGRGPFDYGELRLLILALIAERPTHGYDLIRAIEERFGGSYSPSPGVIYPALAWLDDLGYAKPHEEQGRKTFAITPEGAAFLEENRAAAEELVARRLEGGLEGPPPAILRGMENVKTASGYAMARDQALQP